MQTPSISLGNLTNPQLLQKTHEVARRERELQAELLEYIREVNRRKLYRDLGYPSLFEFMTRELKYSEGAAQRRIDAARLYDAVPAVKEKIQEGAVNLMTLARTQSVIRTEEKRRGQRLPLSFKEKLVNEVSEKPSHEVTKTLFSLLPDAARQVEKKRSESIRAIDFDHSRMTVVIDEKLRKKLERVREVASHKLKGGGWAEVLELLADEYIQKHDHLADTGTPAGANSKNPPKSAAAREPRLESTATVAVKESPKRAPIPVQVRRAVWRRDRGSCQFRNLETGTTCGSRKIY